MIVFRNCIKNENGLLLWLFLSGRLLFAEAACWLLKLRMRLWVDLELWWFVTSRTEERAGKWSYEESGTERINLFIDVWSTAFQRTGSNSSCLPLPQVTRVRTASCPPWCVPPCQLFRPPWAWSSSSRFHWIRRQRSASSQDSTRWVRLSSFSWAAYGAFCAGACFIGVRPSSTPLCQLLIWNGAL